MYQIFDFISYGPTLIAIGFVIPLNNSVVKIQSLVLKRRSNQTIIKEITENQEVESTKLNTPITEHKSAEEEINDILEKDFVNETGVSYRVTLLGYWNEFKNADWHTSGSHFSPFVAWSYYSTIDDPVYEILTKASDGIKEMAETGNPEKLLDEIREKNIRRNNT